MFSGSAVCTAPTSEKHGALCYTPCPTTMFQCGPSACSNTKANCKKEILTMMTTFGYGVASLGLFIATAGASSVKEAAAFAVKGLGDGMRKNAIVNAVKMGEAAWVANLGEDGTKVANKAAYLNDMITHVERQYKNILKCFLK